ncbi:MAG: aconitate hydratase AcnA, partial [Gemmatimonadota bacterium]
EAEAVMLGQPYFMVAPRVVGMKLIGKLPAGCTATDLVLTLTQQLRAAGVVDKFVEFYGPGLANLPLADRATIANMSPEYGATMGFFPVDAETIKYLERTGRDPEQVKLVEAYCRAQRLFRTADTPDPKFNSNLELDMSTVVPSVAGPKRPQDRVALTDLKRSFATTLPELMQTTVPPDRRSQAEAALQRWKDEGGAVTETASMSTPCYPIEMEGEAHEIHDGSVVIAAITSCTNTSNPSVMVGAGLLARNALARGLRSRPWVKTSMAPGSRVVTEYLDKADLTKALNGLGFQTVGYGCTTCIGNSGPLPEPVAKAIEAHSLVAASVLSGNRNFEARIHPLVRANYLMSPMLVVAFALLGRVNADITTEPLGIGDDGEPVFLRDIWPSPAEIQDTLARALGPEMFMEQYASVFEGDAEWQALEVPEGSRFAWAPDSTYVRNPPFFQDLAPEPALLVDIHGARVLAVLGDSVTTDHISPAGAIPKNGPAAAYLREHGVEQLDWNTFGSRRGNHEVMMRGTFGNVRIKNLLVPGKEGNWTEYLPSGEVMSIYDAAMRYIATDTPLVLLVGKEYGSGSSRDWAAKGAALLGVKAVIAESYERIHRSNLVGMGVLPLAFESGQNATVLGLSGKEVISISGIAGGMVPGGTVTVTAVDPDSGKTTVFPAVVRLNSPVELEYLQHGGILTRVLRVFAKS